MHIQYLYILMTFIILYIFMNDQPHLGCKYFQYISKALLCTLTCFSLKPLSAEAVVIRAENFLPTPTIPLLK